VIGWRAVQIDERTTRIENALQRRLGSDCSLAEQTVLTGGASSTTLRLEVRTAAGPRHLILRCASGREGFALNIGKATEARAQAAAHAHDVPTAAVVFVLEPDDGLGEGYVMELVEGEANPQRFLGDAALRATLSEQVGEVLARIHAVPIGELPRLDHETPDQQLRRLRDTYDSFEQPSPVFEVAFKWLEGHVPAPRSATLVHGDFRTGNLLVGPDGIRAVLDWELCHLGDPIEDLGWCCVAAWRFGRLADRVGGFGSVEALRRSYLAAGGTDFTDDELMFWEVYGTLRWGVICLYQVFAHLRGEIPSIERAAIGRRVSEVELDLVRLLH
jgi:aminoglycoside phosphotransferase (APT) family kinase protein